MFVLVPLGEAYTRDLNRGAPHCGDPAFTGLWGAFGRFPRGKHHPTLSETPVAADRRTGKGCQAAQVSGNK